MTDADDEPRAVIVLVVRDREIPLGTIDPGIRCDLGLIDTILRLRLAATRLGWSIRVTHADDELRELVELVGLTDCFGA
jgi:hypothetical protein